MYIIKILTLKVYELFLSSFSLQVQSLDKFEIIFEKKMYETVIEEIYVNNLSFLLV